MADLTTKYLGLTLKNPIIIGSSGLTDSVEMIKKIEESGAAAVVLKSIFEEEILLEADITLDAAVKDGFTAEAFDYYDYKIKNDNLSKYISLIKEVKAAVSIPVIASINCTSSHEWPYFAKKITEAGPDALELNIFSLPTKLNKTASENEKVYYDIVEKLKKNISIPISLKISYYSSNLGAQILKLSESGISGLVLFNRSFSPDFDIDNFTVTTSNVLSKVDELSISLRWVAIMSGRVKCDIAASTGVHDAEGLIKQILAGADTVQIVSVLYEKGVGYVRTMLEELQKWMEKHDFKNLDDFRGKMSQSKSDDPALYERVQFMKYFRGK